MKIKKLGLVILSLVALLFVMNIGSSNVHASKSHNIRYIPKSLKGTWYYGHNMGLTNYKSHTKYQGSVSKTWVKIGKNKWHKINRYIIGTMGDLPGQIPYKLKIAGHYQRVILVTPQNFNSWYVYTKYKTHKTYKIYVKIKY